MTKAHRIAVLGAGPAGALVAERLAKMGEQVLLIDPRVPWEKPCGGGLTAATFDMVPDLQDLQASMQPVRSVRIGVGDAEGVLVELDRPMWMIPRSELSAWQLNRAVGAGATHIPLKVRQIQRLQSGWRLITDQEPVDATHLVGADGAASLVRAVAAPKFRVELASARVGYAPTHDEMRETVTVQLIPGASGYLWDFPRSRHRSIGIGFFGQGWKRDRMDSSIDDYLDSADQCPDYGVESRIGAVIGTAGLGHGNFAQVAGEDFALLGDAAGFADPFTGEGILNALRSAELVAEGWRKDGSFDLYPRLARRALSMEFHRSRLMRSAVLLNDPSFRLITTAAHSRSGLATVTTLVNAINEHRVGILDVMRSWWDRRKEAS
jgi:geranylgeranyl diphosphate/geranylgeranyl-bacteriochlorophyllide a reductase